MPLPDTSATVKRAMNALRAKVAVTGCVLVIERFLSAYWQLIALCFAGFAVLRWGGLGVLPLGLAWALIGVFSCAVVWAVWRGQLAYRFPEQDEVYARLDSGMPGAPVRSLHDQLGIGGDNEDTEALWQLHLERMAARANQAQIRGVQHRLSGRDPYGMRLIALLAAVSAAVFAPNEYRVGRASTAETTIQATAAGSSYEIWAKPPLYTHLPSIYLNEVEVNKSVPLAVGSQILVRAYGPAGSVKLSEDISVAGNAAIPQEAGELAEVTFNVARSGIMRISPDGGQTREWVISMRADRAPSIEVTGEMTRSLQGAMRLPFRARDDYGVVGGGLHIELDLDAVPRKFGLALDPEPRAALSGDLPLPFSGGTDDFEGMIEEDFAQHVWAGLPVVLGLSAEDAAGNLGEISPLRTELAKKRFFDPLSAALVDVRRQLLWNRLNATRAEFLLRAMSHRPDGVFPQDKAYLMTRTALRRLEYGAEQGGLSDEVLDEVAELLWNAALLIEDGDLADAADRLRRAQERLNEAMENGATDEEIAELMQELRAATQNYMNHLADQGPDGDAAPSGGEGETLSQDQLQEMMDRIQELMEQGRMDEAQELLRELQAMMENMQVVRQEGGGGGEQQRQEEEMQDLLREQQELADDTFRELQEQFDEGQPQDGTGEGEEQGQQSGGQQQGGQQSGEQGGEQGQQQGAQGQSGRQGQGQAGQSGTGGDESSDLAGRQQALREMLERQLGALGQGGGETGEGTRDALGNAQEQARRAEENIEEGNLGEALGDQSEVLDSIRQGLRALRDQQRQAQNQGNNGETRDQAGQGQGRSFDPLGRPQDQSRTGRRTDENARNDGLDATGRRKKYQELFEDLRNRSQDQTRPEYELDYLKRLLDRF
ncbi:hypothetical protein GCM10007939_13510 [Amylibacter marinus]|uniref:TIGR02302 family protein n=1 Tax=Amylibacter marinus TaxID=1475483 RepID=A0ABQ5VVF4_9RHOB|nr:DUF4175 family protein [Amylibacter marinus]GLQ35068.1 hypothetical protein GCM10007939_13510 [Amylibacter marinus]